MNTPQDSDIEAVPESRRTLMRGVVATTLASIAAFTVLLIHFGSRGGGWLYFDDVGQGVGALAACASAGWTAWRSTGRGRRGWGLISLGMGSWAVGEVVWTVVQWQTGTSPSSPSWCDLFFLLAPCLLAAGVVTFVVTPAGRMSQARAVLEALMISGGMLMAGWALLFGPTVARSNDSVASQLVNIGYPVLDVVVISLLIFAISRRAQQERGNLPLLIVGLLLMALADMSFWYLTSVRDYPGSAVSDAGWYAGFVLIALAAGSRGWRPQVAEADVKRNLAFLAVPELTLLACMFATIGAQLAGATVRLDWVLLVTAAALLGIGVVHRMTLVAENLLLTANLEERVRRRTEELSTRERYFRSLIQRSSDVIAVLDADLTIRDITESVSDLFGFDRSLLVGHRLTERADLYGDLIAAVQASSTKPGRVHRLEWSLRNPRGEVRFAESTIADLLTDPDIGGFVINTRDVTERALLEQEMRRQAFHDSLTALANRALFHDRLAHAVSRSRRTGELVGVMLIDLDGFKAVNDSLGHQAGDEVLRIVAERLTAGLPPDDTVARLGGDEFAVLLEGLESSEEATEWAERLLELVRDEMEVGGQSFRLTASIGVIVSDSADAPIEDLIRDADTAMYACKRDGKDRARHFEAAMHDEARERFRLEAELRGAIERHEIVLHYQPTYELATGQLEGFEALVRWEHPELGLLGPDRFIPVAEESGVIVPLGRWILGEAMRQLAEWSRAVGDRGSMSIAINVSARQLRDPELVADVGRAIDRAGIDPRRVVLELTESMLLHDIDEVIEVLGRLRTLGVRLAIDDFGTGYASLSYLRRLPVDILKVDKCFVDGAATGDGPRLLEAILQLGQTLGLRTVAEGIEEAEQLDIVRAGGCNIGQGYHFSRPLPAAAVWDLLTDQIGELVG